MEYGTFNRGGGGLVLRFEGATTAAKELSRLDFKIRKNIVIAAVRAGNAIIVKEARTRAPKRTGRMARSIRGFASLSRNASGVVKGTVRGKATKKQREKGKAYSNYIHLVAGGTKPHRIPREDGKKTVLNINGKAFSAVTHPGARANYWMVDAGRAAFQPATAAFYAKFEQRMLVELTKLRYWEWKS